VLLVTAALVVACGGGTAQPKPPTKSDDQAQAASTPPPATKPAAHADPTAAVAPVPVGPEDGSLGNPLAPVTIVAFLDLECPFSARVQPTLKAVLETYGPERVRLVVKHHPMPFHVHADAAATMAELVHDVAGNEAFMRFVELAFAGITDLSDARLRRFAREVGVAERHFSSENLARAAKKVHADAKLADSVGTYGTPGFFINGRLLSGAQAKERFTAIVDEELVAASAALAGGVAKEQLYAVRSAHNFQSPKKSREEREEPDTTVWRIPAFADDPARGGQEPLVTIVELGGFECPFTKKVDATLDTLLDRYGDDLRVVWKDRPLSNQERGRPAAALARAAYAKGGDALFWQAYDALFAAEALDDETLARISKALGLAPGAYRTELASKKFEARLKETELASLGLRAGGTPHFFVNGVRLAGARPLQDFERLVERQLQVARALVARGVPRAGVYAEIMKGAKAAPPPEKRALPGALPGPAPARGPASAPVTIVQFASFACPFSARVNATLDQLLKKYGQKIRIEWHYLPFPYQTTGMLSAEAAHEVFTQKGATAFFRYHDALFENQKNLGRARLVDLAAKQGVDIGRFEQALDEHTHRARVEADVAAATSASITGTPAFLVGEYFVSGAQPLVVLEHAVELALADAKH